MQDFHGIPVDLAYPDIAGDPLRPLLAPFDSIGDEAGPALKIVLEASSGRRPFQVESGWTPTFCHGLAQGYTGYARHLLTDGVSWVEVAPREARLSGQVAVPVTEVPSGMLHVAFCILLRERGVFEIHAAVACVRDKALVIIGDAGAGKTTTLLALLRAGASFLGDDRALVRASDDDVELLAYPREFHVTPRTLRAFPELDDGATPASIDGKFRINARERNQDLFRRSFKGELILLAPLVCSAATTCVSRLPVADALGRLLGASASVALEVLPHRDEQLQLLTRLANSAVAYEVQLGADMLSNPEHAARRLLVMLGAT